MSAPLEPLARDLRYGVRSLTRTPGFTALAVASLALGIMATTAIYSVLHAVVLDPFPYKDVDNLMSVRVVEPVAARRPDWLFDRPVSRDRRAKHDLRWRDRLDRSATCSGPATGDPQRLRGNHGTFNTFDVMGVPPLLGRTPTAADAQAGRGAGRRAGLPVLAASVRRRSATCSDVSCV